VDRGGGWFTDKKFQSLGEMEGKRGRKKKKYEAALVVRDVQAAKRNRGETVRRLGEKIGGFMGVRKNGGARETDRILLADRLR